VIHRRWFRIVVGASLLCGIGSLPVRAGDVEIHYAPEENLERIDVDLIRLARVKIDMAVYSLTDWAVVDALIEARRRGVGLRIVLDPSQQHALDRLRPIADDVRMKPAGAYMHLKSYAVDGRLLRSGSANLSASGLKQQDNDLVVVRDLSAAKSFEARFQQLWDVSRPLPNSAAYAEPASKDAPTPAKDCAIKGNVNRKGEKIFHVPGSRDYARVTITGAEERMFCSAAEATAAGWRPAAGK
jgi:phosphatidylserine/phosphatidylglycerophosphate/cardiolipin synthase-like enzyme